MLTFIKLLRIDYKYSYLQGENEPGDSLQGCCSRKDFGDKAVDRMMSIIPPNYNKCGEFTMSNDEWWFRLGEL